ncbi:NAD(P)H-dependent glycerol-3-phosphate dehydrogenase [Jannaschia sp. W003]|uniref:NAD(P)H-dependent glycerol-3-phosphate dehydrogenase n=1 Tax=Jannaschia sp. W003 TaxID=2867012 RepID=UPI0021A5A414|nr:NAD(P)H-dependent glycerol-3-phosphate dehydrogenase [Jannaschia sp. W003]UWQ22371.1 NAD(P)H-dependent glycerol-3-phosphate dehydrogenase [Jannaschia sp. W003]
MSVGVVGAGAFGGALAIAIGRARPVALWGRDGAAMEAARASRTLARLPGATLPEGVAVTADPADLADCDTLLLAVPTQALAATIAALPLAPRRAVAACKGVELGTLRGPTALLQDRWPDATAAILSGPSFAADIARALPTALVLATSNEAEGAALQRLLATPALRVYRSTDVAGVELGGALKNVVAIACGAAIGAGLGESARAALMTRGMAETVRLATALGARPETLMGLSGLGDLALTCASPQSRNFALGLALGRGEPLPGATAEGVPTAAAALDLGRRHGLDLPITAAVHALTTGRLGVAEAIDALLSRDLTHE